MRRQDELWGTALAVVLSQFHAEYILKKLSVSLSPNEADVLSSDLWNLEERVREDVFSYLDEEANAGPSVEVRIPTMPSGHWKHSWHLARVPVRKATDILNDAANWYAMMATRDFGAVHEWLQV